MKSFVLTFSAWRCFGVFAIQEGLKGAGKLEGSI